MAAAAVGTFGAYSAASASPRQTYVALTRDVPAGQELTSADLEVVEADLSARQRQVVVTDLSVAEGAVAVNPLQTGQLLHTGDVVELAGVEGRAQLSIPVEPARANNGELIPGERVDVIATSTEAGAATTGTIARDAMVVRVFRGEQSLGSSSSVVVTLSLTAGELEPVADAAASDVLALARVSGLAREEVEATGGG